MKLTKETDYAIRALTYLCTMTEEHADAKNIALIQNIPESFAFKVLRKLVTADIVESIRGANGGYKLKKSPTEVTLLDIITAIEGLPTLNSCLDGTSVCPLHADGNGYCLAHQELYRVQTLLRRELSAKSLSELLVSHLV